MTRTTKARKKNYVLNKKGVTAPICFTLLATIWSCHSQGPAFQESGIKKRVRANNTQTSMETSPENTYGDAMQQSYDDYTTDDYQKNNSSYNDQKPSQNKNGSDLDDLLPSETSNRDDIREKSDIGESIEIEKNSKGNAQSIYEDESSNTRSEVFNYGGDSHVTVVDFLFVIDNSCSMKGIVPILQEGFLKIATQGKLPARSKVAVMTTMHGDDSDLSKPGYKISTYPGIEKEPGFLDFVNGDAIKSYKEQVPQKSSSWPKPGCKKWFDPGQLNSQGDFCIEAATQSSFSCLGAEPGITAFGQLIDKNKGSKTFRNGASLNVIFVADTHDPGINSRTLKNRIPSYEKLKKMLARDNNLASIKFHAIAPRTSCTGESLWDKSYYQLAKNAGGIQADSCSSNDYSEHLEEISKKSTVMDESVFALSKPAKTIISVTIDGKPTSAYSLNPAKTVLRVTNLNDLDKQTIVVTYGF